MGRLSALRRGGRGWMGRLSALRRGLQMGWLKLIPEPTLATVKAVAKMGHLALRETPHSCAVRVPMNGAPVR